MRIFGVILAGGQARRMGGVEKGLLDLGGQSLLAEVIARISPQCESLALNANGDPTRFSGFGLRVLPDDIPGHPGPLAGILAAMEAGHQAGFSHILSVAADTPFFPRDLAARLAVALSPAHPLALAASRAEGRLNRHPTFGLWPVDLQVDLRAALLAGQGKVGLWAEKHGAALVEFRVAGHDPFFNVNTPGDLAVAQAIWRGLQKQGQA